MNEIQKCELCGEPMPPGEQMFKFHGYSGPCPKPPLAKQPGDVPTKPGYFWAKWKIPADGTHEGADLCPSDNWEVVQVNDNNGLGDEKFSVSVPGVRETQWLDCFFWGKFVTALEPA